MSAGPGDDRGLRTLSRGLQLLEAIVSAEGSGTAKSLAATVGVGQSTCYQILKTLELAGYVVRTTGGAYEVGPAVPSMFRRLRSTLEPSPKVTAALRALRDLTGQTSYACVLSGRGILLQEVLEGHGMLVVRMLEPGMRSNVHARASCRAVLAFLPEAERRRILPAGALGRLTPYTITDRRILRAELAAVPEQGYAVELQEYQLGVACLAAPYFDVTGHVKGSLTVAMPIDVLRADELGIAEMVIGCAEAAGHPRVDSAVKAT